LLALPDFPRHDNPCVERGEVEPAISDFDEQLTTNNPFSVLAKLKNTGD